MDLKEVYQSAVHLYKTGKLLEAKALSQQLIQSQPAFADAYLLQGLIAKQQGLYPEALKQLRLGLHIKPSHVPLLHQLAQTLLLVNKHDEALKCISKALAIEPENTLLKITKGKILRQAGQLEEAEQLFQEILAQEPGNLSALNNLANCFQSRKAFSEALVLYQKALAIDANHAALWNNMGNLYVELQQPEEGIKHYHKALAVNPDFLPALQGLARVAYANQDRALAKKWLIEAIRKHPLQAEPHFTLAGIYKGNGEIEESIVYYKKTVQLNPNHAMAHNNLGMIYFSIGLQREAEDAFNAALQADPKCAEALYGMAKVKEFYKDFSQSIAFIEKAQALTPSFHNQLFFDWLLMRLRIADWSNYEALLEESKERLKQYLQDDSQQFQIPPLSLKYLPLAPEWHTHVANKVAGLIEREMQAAHKRLAFEHAPINGGKIRIGYLSADFRLHAVGMLLHELFPYHDRNQFEIHAYSIVNNDDKYHRNFKTGADVFHEITKLSYTEAAKRIYADGIHILVDLGGYTTYTRSQILALHPAPIQMHFMGFPGTMGGSLADYVLADEILISQDQESQYSEKVLRMDHAFFSSAFETSEKIFTRKDLGLPEDGVVYCCFNSYYKISPKLFTLWMDLLKSNAKAVIWLSKENEWGMANLKKQASEQGIDPNRLVFAERLPMPEYLSALSQADLFLDTFNYSAGSTAVCALWAGVPVLTYCGNANASRMGASIVKAANLEDFIVDSEEAYFEKANALGNQPELLIYAKKALAENKTQLPLFDLKKAALALEKAYMQAVRLRF